jgi:hypothetical protein
MDFIHRVHSHVAAVARRSWLPRPPPLYGPLGGHGRQSSATCRIGGRSAAVVVDQGTVIGHRHATAIKARPQVTGAVSLPAPATHSPPHQRTATWNPRQGPSLFGPTRTRASGWSPTCWALWCREPDAGWSHGDGAPCQRRCIHLRYSLARGRDDDALWADVLLSSGFENAAAVAGLFRTGHRARHPASMTRPTGAISPMAALRLFQPRRGTEAASALVWQQDLLL